MLRRIMSLVLLGAASAVLAAAASLTVMSGTLGAARAITPRCTTAGLSVFQNLSAGTVVSVSIGGIPAACGGATISASVNNGITSASGSATVPAGGGAVTVTIGGAPMVTVAEQTDMVIVGP